MDFGDLVASAEQLTAEIDGVRAGDLPRFFNLHMFIMQFCRNFL